MQTGQNTLTRKSSWQKLKDFAKVNQVLAFLRTRMCESNWIDDIGYIVQIDIDLRFLDVLMF